MQGVWKIVSWARGSGNDEEASKSADESDVTSPRSKYSSSSIRFSSPVSAVQDDAEEFEDSYGQAESESDVSASLQFRRASTPGSVDRSQWADEYGSQASCSRLVEPEEDPLRLQFRELKLLQPVATGLQKENGAYKSGSYATSRKNRSRTIQSADGAPGRLRGGLESSRLPSSQKASLLASGLKQVQLQKLENVNQMDKDWDCVFPDVQEEPYVWPWPTLSEQQVELGIMDFRKYLVLLASLGEVNLRPENVLSMDQIEILKMLPLEDIAKYICHEVAISHGISRERFPFINRAWLMDNKALSFECHVDKDGDFKIAIVKPRQVSTLLHRTFGEDRVMSVYFNQEPAADKFKTIREGILVGLRRYRFWTFKDSGKDDFKNRFKAEEKDYERAVKCLFVCTESLADIDLHDTNFKYFTRIHAARCHVMHAHTVTTMPKFASRLQLALSKSTRANIDLTKVEIKKIPDILSKTLDDSGKFMSHTEGTGEISVDVAKQLPYVVVQGQADAIEESEVPCLTCLYMRGGRHLVPRTFIVNIGNKGYPTLWQIRLFWKGMAIKGTVQVNHKLKGLKILYRESMVKVWADDVLRDFPTVNSLEILNTSRKPKERNLSQDLIILLTIGGVPASFFLELVRKALDNVRNIFTTREIAFKEVESSISEDSLRDQTLRMLMSGIPMNHPYMQRNLRLLTQNRILGLRKGCVPIPDCFYLMGTSDPTKGVLKRNQVAIAMGDGKVCGKVLVYKNPGKHWGDIHIFEAIWDSRLDPYVGPSKYSIFFSVQGERPIVDEIANSDLDGDLYWVCANTELIWLFTDSSPWKRLGGKINYPEDDMPGYLTPDELERALFKKFISTRFQKFKPMPMAATYWKAHMDRYLTLKDEKYPPDELSSISENIEDLIEIFYRALDANKSGEEVMLPNNLRPQMWPHFMKEDNYNRTYYKSSSILGQIYDMANISTDNLGYSHRATMTYDPNFEYGQFGKYIEKWRGLLKRYNAEMQQTPKDKRDALCARYNEILVGVNKPLTQIWEEASALHLVNYEHALTNMRKNYAPSLYCAMNVAGIQLCEVYARRKGQGEPYVWAPSSREEIIRPSYLISKPQ